MSRGRDDNHLCIYRRAAGEADHEHRHLLDTAEVHQMRRGNKYAAAHCLRMILANDDRPRTMHAHAERADRHRLPPVVADALARNDQRRAHRRDAWRQHAAVERAREAASPTNASSVTTAAAFSVTMATGWSCRPSVAAWSHRTS
jgi:hypothetical protein